MKLTVTWLNALVRSVATEKFPFHPQKLFVEEVQGAEALDSTSKSAKDKRNPHDITVETYPSRLESPRGDWGLLPEHSRETTSVKDKETAVVEDTDEIGFFSGNPFVEITKGILHLYKEELSIALLHWLIIYLLNACYYYFLTVDSSAN